MSSVYSYITEVNKEFFIVLLFLILYVTYYLVEVVKRPLLVCRAGRLRALLEEEVPLVRERYWPTPWCVQAHLQTVVGSLLRSRLLPRARYRREVLALADGGRVALDWAEGDGGGGERGTLLLLPGVSGDGGADYARVLAAAARRLRLRCVVVNHRGLGGLELASPRLYCALSHGDFAEALAAVRARAPGPLLAAGVSLGGLLLAHHLAAAGGDSALLGALAVSAPLDVPRGAAALGAGAANALLSRHVAAGLRRTARRLRPLAAAAADWRALERARSVREFDAAFTARHFGFASVDEYYAAASLRGRLAAVRAPLLCLCAADDPFQPLGALPLAEARASAAVALLVPARGGHIGFLEGWRPAAPPPHRQYIARLATQYFGALLRRAAAGRAPADLCGDLGADLCGDLGADLCGDLGADGDS